MLLCNSFHNLINEQKSLNHNFCRRASWIVASCATIILSVSGCTKSGLTDESPSPTDRAPDFVLPDVNGGEVRLYDYIGKQPMALYFFKSDCEPCLKDIESMLESNYKIKIALILIDDSAFEQDVAHFLKTTPFKEVTYLRDIGARALDLYHRNHKTPVFVIINKKGDIVSQINLVDFLNYSRRDLEYWLEDSKK